MQDKICKNAMNKDIKETRKNDIQELQYPSKEKKNGVKCIDKAKKNIKVEVERLKAKFVTKGYKQQ